MHVASRVLRSTWRLLIHRWRVLTHGMMRSWHVLHMSRQVVVTLRIVNISLRDLRCMCVGLRVGGIVRMHPMSHTTRMGVVLWVWLTVGTPRMMRVGRVGRSCIVHYVRWVWWTGDIGGKIVRWVARMRIRRVIS